MNNDQDKKRPISKAEGIRSQTEKKTAVRVDSNNVCPKQKSYDLLAKDDLLISIASAEITCQDGSNLDVF